MTKITSDDVRKYALAYRGFFDCLSIWLENEQAPGLALPVKCWGYMLLEAEKVCQTKLIGSEVQYWTDLAAGVMTKSYDRINGPLEFVVHPEPFRVIEGGKK
jgi:hypothetical protein